MTTIAVTAAAQRFITSEVASSKPTARAKADQIRTLAAEGQTREAIARELGTGVASVYRVLATGRPTKAYRAET
jgi:DNA invertase Pin-like site-specific DNA recombinase